MDVIRDCMLEILVNFIIPMVLIVILKYVWPYVKKGLTYIVGCIYSLLIR